MAVHNTRRGSAFGIALILASMLAAADSPDGRQPSKTTLADSSLEELLDIQVTSVSKKEEKLSQAAAAIYVITQEDIRRSGAVTIPDLLRMVPGLEVAQINTNTWAVSARGFNDAFANKLLVLVDGRSVYSELFSGTYWDVQDMILEDIDRIEVIRGPGATVWGANAVNGVIDIITKRAQDTQGALVSVGGGITERGLGEFRYGGKLGSRAFYRAYAKVLDLGPALDTNPALPEGNWAGFHAGFRLDWAPSPRDSIMLEGDVYDTGLDRSLEIVTLTPPFSKKIQGREEANGGSVMARWQRHFLDGSGMALQVSYEHSLRDVLQAAPVLNILDVDFQHELALSNRNSLLWGLGFRLTDVNVNDSLIVHINPPIRHDSLFQGFVQDEVQLIPESLTLTAGSKFEHNPFSGFEIQPSVRLAWTPMPRQTFWAAVSRAVRTPSVIDVGLYTISAAFAGPSGLPTLVTVQGNPHLHAEDLLSYEAGYRIQPSSRVSVDLAAFYNVYDHLHSIEPGQPFVTANPLPLHLVLPEEYGARISARTYGAELSANVKLASWWKVSPGYTWLRVIPSANSATLDPATPIALAHGDPQHQFQIRSYMDLPRRLQLDVAAYSVSSLAAQNVPAYIRIDARLGWQASERLELGIVGQNLLDGSHVEFFSPADGDDQPFEVPRSVYGKITWRF